MKSPESAGGTVSSMDIHRDISQSVHHANGGTGQTYDPYSPTPRHLERGYLSVTTLAVEEQWHARLVA
jgi:hypothetical protein